MLVAVIHVRMEQPVLMVLMAMLVYVRMDLKEPTVKQVNTVCRFVDAVEITFTIFVYTSTYGLHAVFSFPSKVVSGQLIF